MQGNEARQWLARIKYFRAEFPFGPTEVFRNEEGRLHREDGPALITPIKVQWFRDGQPHGMMADIYGTQLYFFRGRRVPNRYFTHPEELTVKEIFGNPNAEVRFAGLHIYGFDRLLEEGAVTIVDHETDTDYLLFRINKVFDEPVQFVRLWNSTPEPDGSYKAYYLCVPPDVNTVRAAVAWTFRKEADTYRPVQET